jgi:REP element-mobilizing transposase RayT
LIAIGGDLDHVHLLVRLAPSVAVSQLVGEVKGASSHLMTHEIAIGNEFKWQGGYGAFTVSPRALAKVADYVKNQKAHHENRRTFTDWERCYEETESNV